MYSFYAKHTYGGQLPYGGSRYIPSLPGKVTGTVVNRPIVASNIKAVVTGTIRIKNPQGIVINQVLSGSIKPRTNIGRID